MGQDGNVNATSGVTDHGGVMRWQLCRGEKDTTGVNGDYHDYVDFGLCWTAADDDYAAFFATAVMSDSGAEWLPVADALIADRLHPAEAAKWQAWPDAAKLVQRELIKAKAALATRLGSLALVG